AFLAVAGHLLDGFTGLRVGPDPVDPAGEAGSFHRGADVLLGQRAGRVVHRFRGVEVPRPQGEHVLVVVGRFPGVLVQVVHDVRLVLADDAGDGPGLRGFQGDVVPVDVGA